MIVAIIAETKTDKKKSLNLSKPWMNILNGNLFNQVCEEGPHPNLVKREKCQRGAPSATTSISTQFQRQNKTVTKFDTTLHKSWTCDHMCQNCQFIQNEFVSTKAIFVSNTGGGRLSWLLGDHLRKWFHNLHHRQQSNWHQKMKLNFFHPRKIKDKNHLQALGSYHAHQEYGSHLSESWHILY